MLLAVSIVFGLIAIGLIYLATLEGSFNVRRGLQIDAPIEQVFAAVRDFKTWPEWSPWLMHEPGAKIVYSDDYDQEGGYYTWDGKQVGAGKLSHLALQANSRIEQRIEFIRPFKSVNRVNWYFSDKQDTSFVEWEMNGEMPFLFRFMTAQMEPLIGKDYELGLALLSGYLHGDETAPSIEFCGEEFLDDFLYWSIPFDGNLRDMQSTRKSGLAALEAAAGDQAGLGLTIYQQIYWQQTHYRGEIAIPVSTASVESNYTNRQFKAGHYFKLEVVANHDFLPLAWYAAFSHCRMHKIKLDKSRPSLEIYNKAPAGSEDRPVKTTLYLAIKGAKMREPKKMAG